MQYFEKFVLQVMGPIAQPVHIISNLGKLVIVPNSGIHDAVTQTEWLQKRIVGKIPCGHNVVVVNNFCEGFQS